MSFLSRLMGQSPDSNLSPADFVADHDADAPLLDVRTPGEYAEGHLAGSVNVDVMGRTFKQEIEAMNLPSDSPVYLYCRSGNRSGQATKTLREMGHEGAVNIGGLRASGEGRSRGGVMDLGALQFTQSMAAVAVLAALLLAETAHPFFDFFRDRQRLKDRGAHALRNLALGLANGALVALVFAGLWVVAADTASARGWGLLNLVELPTWLHVAGAVLLLDMWTYAWHRANHRIPFLWRFHRVHHSDAHMDVTTASRFHTGEIVLSSALRIPLLLLIGATAWELVLYETMMFAVVQFHHANIGLPPAVSRVLRAVIVTPEIHKVHHSRLQLETDSNYSALFSWWDRLFGSFRLRERPEDIEFGLNQFPGEESVGSLLRMPLAPHYEEDPPEASGATRPPTTSRP